MLMLMLDVGWNKRFKYRLPREEVEGSISSRVG